MREKNEKERKNENFEKNGQNNLKNETMKKMKQKCTERDDTSSSSAAALRDGRTPLCYPQLRGLRYICWWCLFTHRNTSYRTSWTQPSRKKLRFVTSITQTKHRLTHAHSIFWTLPCWACSCRWLLPTVFAASAFQLSFKLLKIIQQIFCFVHMITRYCCIRYSFSFRHAAISSTIVECIVCVRLPGVFSFCANLVQQHFSRTSGRPWLFCSGENQSIPSKLQLNAKTVSLYSLSLADPLRKTCVTWAMSLLFLQIVTLLTEKKQRASRISVAIHSFCFFHTKSSIDIWQNDRIAVSSDLRHIFVRLLSAKCCFGNLQARRILSSLCCESFLLVLGCDTAPLLTSPTSCHRPTSFRTSCIAARIDHLRFRKTRTSACGTPQCLQELLSPDNFLERPPPHHLFQHTRALWYRKHKPLCYKKNNKHTGKTKTKQKNWSAEIAATCSTCEMFRAKMATGIISSGKEAFPITLAWMALSFFVHGACSSLLTIGEYTTAPRILVYVSALTRVWMALLMHGLGTVSRQMTQQWREWKTPKCSSSARSKSIT